MRSNNYPFKPASCFILLLLLTNVSQAVAQDPGPNIAKPTTCIGHIPGTVGSVYSYAYTGTSAAAFWTVKGDIQLLDGSGNVVDTLRAPTANIRSTAGYGKGRLILTYDQAGCSAQQEYVDVYKAFSLFDEWPSNVPENKNKNGIVGPACLAPNTLYTYTINPVLSVNADQEIGTDRYRWVVPPGWTIRHASADSSYISLVTPAVIGTGDSLRVYVGACNPAPYSLKLTQPVPVPVITPVSCVPVSSTGSTTITLSVQNPGADYAYDWELPAHANWQFAGGYDGLDETQVRIVIDNAADAVRVVARRRTPSGNPACDATPSAYLRIRRSLSTGNYITGLSCVEAGKLAMYTMQGADADFRWTFTPNPGGTGYGFSVPNPSGPRVDFRAGTTGGVLSVTTADADCGNPVRLNITVAPARPPAIAGPSCVNANSGGLIYSVDPVPGATGYTWTVSGSLSSSSTLLNGGTSITVNAGGTGGTISVTANKGTCASTPLSKSVAVSVVAPTTVTASQSCLNRGAPDEITFSAGFASPAPGGQTYEWRVIYPAGITAGWTVKSGTAAGASSITYVTNTTTGSYRVEVRAVQAGCTASGWVSSPVVTTVPRVALSVIPILDEWDDRIGSVLEATPVTGASYQWTQSVNGGTPQVIAGETGPEIQVFDEPGVTTQYCVTATLNGCTTNVACQTPDTAGTTAARVGSGEADIASPSRQVRVYPNPAADGQFTLQLPAFREPAGVVLKNLRGQVVYRGEVREARSKLSAGKLGSGVYLLQVTLDGKTVIKKVVIKK